MKLFNKIIGVTMAVIILFTSFPMRAADFDINLDTQQLNELKREINSSITKEFEETPLLFEGIPDLETLRQRYITARENYEQNLKIFTKQKTKQSKKDYERYIEFLKEEAQKRIQTDSKYDGFINEKEKEQVAFYSVLLEEIEKSDKERETYYNRMIGDIFTGLLAGIVVGVIAYASDANIIGILISGGIGATIVMLLMFLFIAPAKQPVFNPSLFPSELIAKFLDNPFLNLAKFNKREVNDFGAFYIKSKDCAQVLYDAVDIEYYISRNPTIENMQAEIYTRSIVWHNLTTEKKAEYIHNLAERLRAEAK